MSTRGAGRLTRRGLIGGAVTGLGVGALASGAGAVRAAATSPVDGRPFEDGPKGRLDTVFGYNSLDASAEQKFTWWGRLPCGRRYYGTNTLPADGSNWAPRGSDYKAMGLHRADVVSSKRLSVCFRMEPHDIKTSSSERVKQVFAWSRRVPDGVTVYLTDHEYNIQIARGVATAEEYVRAYQIIAAEVDRANELNAAEGGGRVVPVVNIAGSGLISGAFDLDQAPPASTMPDYTQFWADAYDNPRGYPTGYKGYGTRPSPDIGREIVDDVYDAADALGYLTNTDGGTRGWGIGEFNSSRRSAPRLDRLDTRLGWGPRSPHDVSGAVQADAITAYVTRCLGTTTRPAPAKVVLLWHGEDGVNWNNSFTSGGREDRDDGTADDPGPYFQGFPVTTDPTRPAEAWRSYLERSA